MRAPSLWADKFSSKCRLGNTDCKTNESPKHLCPFACRVRVHEGDAVIDRRSFIGALALGLMATPLAAQAQQAGRVYRIGYLSAPTRVSVENALQAFLRK